MPSMPLCSLCPIYAIPSFVDYRVFVGFWSSYPCIYVPTVPAVPKYNCLQYLPSHKAHDELILTSRCYANRPPTIGQGENK